MNMSESLIDVSWEYVTHYQEIPDSYDNSKAEAKEELRRHLLREEINVRRFKDDLTRLATQNDITIWSRAVVVLRRIDICIERVNAIKTGGHTVYSLDGMPIDFETIRSEVLELYVQHDQSLSKVFGVLCTRYGFNPKNYPLWKQILSKKAREWGFPGLPKENRENWPGMPAAIYKNSVKKPVKRKLSQDGSSDDTKKSRNPVHVLRSEGAAPPKLADAQLETKIFVNYTISQDCTTNGNRDSKRLLNALQGRDGAKGKNLLCALQGRPRDLKIRSSKLFSEEGGNVVVKKRRL